MDGRDKMKNEKLIRAFLESRVKILKALWTAYELEQFDDFSKILLYQEQLEDLCWILDIEPITRYNVT